MTILVAKTSSIVGQHNNTIMYQKYDGITWKPNDIISIKLDRNKWVITFYLNDKEQYQMPLQKDHDYFLMITVSDEFEYKLLS